jgi:hypothetical protein
MEHLSCHFSATNEETTRSRSAAVVRLLLRLRPMKRGLGRCALVYRVTGVLYRRGCNVVSNSEFVDREIVAH